MSGRYIGKGRVGGRMITGRKRKASGQLFGDRSQPKVLDYLEEYYDEDDNIIATKPERLIQCASQQSEVLGIDISYEPENKCSLPTVNNISEQPIAVTKAQGTEENIIADLMELVKTLQIQMQDLGTQSMSNYTELKLELVYIASVLQGEKTKVVKLQDENKILKERTSVCEGMIMRQDREIEKIKEDMIQMKCHQLKKNIVVSGLNETDKESEEELTH